MTIDYDKLEQEQWVKDLMNSDEYVEVQKGKPYAGKIQLVKKGK